MCPVASVALLVALCSLPRLSSRLCRHRRCFNLASACKITPRPALNTSLITSSLFPLTHAHVAFAIATATACVFVSVFSAPCTKPKDSGQYNLLLSLSHPELSLVREIGQGGYFGPLVKVLIPELKVGGSEVQTQFRADQLHEVPSGGNGRKIASRRALARADAQQKRAGLGASGAFLVRGRRRGGRQVR